MGTAEATKELYGVIQTPVVRSALESVNAASQLPLFKLIHDLQSDPRPPGHESAEAYGEGFAQLLADETVPPYIIIYRVDEERKRVIVIALMEKRW